MLWDNKLKNRIISLFAVMFLFAMPVTVHAAGDGWFDKSNGSRDSIYGATEAEVATAKSEDEVGALEGLGAEVIFSIARGINNLVSMGGNLNLSIDNVVLGRLASGTEISYLQFDLSPGNPWGILGAKIFVILRSFVYGAFLLLLVWMMIIQMVKGNGSKGRAETKLIAQNMVFFFAMIYVIPYIADVVLYVKDVFMYLIVQGLSNGGAVTSLLGSFESNYESRKSIINACLYLATVCAGAFFAANYLGIALTEFGLFGTAPTICLLSAKNRKLFDGWTTTFFLNFFVPVIDAAFILVPSLLDNIAASNGDVDPESISFLMIKLFVIWAIIPSRNAILRALSGAPGGGLPAAGSGLSGLAAAAMMAARAGRGIGRGIKGSGGSSGGSEESSPKEDRQQAAFWESLSQDTQSVSGGNLSGNGALDAFLSGGEDGGIVGDSASAPDVSDITSNIPNDASIDGNAAGAFGAESASSIEDITGSEGFGAESVGESTGEDISPDIYESTQGMPDLDEMNAMSGTVGETAGLDEVSDYPNETINTSYTDITAGDTTGYAGADDSTVLSQVSAPAADSGPVDGKLYGQNFADLSDDVKAHMGEEGQARYNNLQNMEVNTARATALDKEISNMNASVAKNDADIASYDTRIAGIDSGIATEKANLQRANDEYSKAQRALAIETAGRDDCVRRLQQHGADMPDELRHDLNHQSQDHARNMETAQRKMHAEMRNIDTAREQINRYNSDKAQTMAQKTAVMEARTTAVNRRSALQQQRASYQSAAQACQVREKAYASVDRSRGGSGQSYPSASSYIAQQKVDTNRAKLANYKNFDSSKELSSALTPDERARYLRERALRTNVRQVAGTAAGIGAGALGAVAMTYGGPTAMMMGATVGSRLPGEAAHLGKSAVTTVGDTVESVKEVAPRVKEGTVKAARVLQSGVTTAAKTIASSSRSSQGAVHRGSISPEHLRRPATNSGTPSYGADTGEDVKQIFRNNMSGRV